MTEQQREAFERWYNAEYVRPIIPADRTEGGYQHPDAQAAWDAWQAAISHAEGEAAAVAHQYQFADPISGRPFWRFDPGLWNGQRPKASRPLYARPAPQVAVPEGWHVRRGVTDVEGEGGVGFVIGTPPKGGVRTNTSVWLDDQDPAHRLLAIMLAAAPTAPAGEPTVKDSLTVPAPQVAVPELTDEMVVRGGEFLHDSGYRIDGDPDNATEQQQALAEGLFNAMLAAAPTAPAGEPDDLTTLVRRLAHSLRKAAPGHALAEKALDYLSRQHPASPLRSGQQPVGDPDGLPSDWRRVVEGAADTMQESAKQHRERGDNGIAAVCERFGAMLRDEILSAPAPDEREIAARALDSVAVELDTHLWRDAAIRVRGRAESIRSGTDAPSAIRRAVSLLAGKEGDES